MQLKGKKAWGIVWDSRFQFKIYLFYFFLGKEVKKNYNRLLVRIVLYIIEFYVNFTIVNFIP